MVAPAWTAQQQPTVLIGIANTGPVSFEWSASFANLWNNRPPGTARLKLAPYDVALAREIAGDTAIAQNFKWLFFLDDDVIPPADIIQRLIAHNKPIVSGYYARRHPPLHALLLRKASESPLRLELIKDFAPGSLVEVDAVGAGCMLIAVEVLRKIPKPWFVMTQGRAVDGTSEDYFFVDKAKQYGFRTWVDTGLKCGHKGTFNVIPADNPENVQFLAESPNP